MKEILKNFLTTLLKRKASMLPRISIITPSFNQGCYLEQCITSVLEQEYPNLEYIIIDGNSSDDSVKIIKKYEQQLYFWISEADNGQSDAINKGFSMASGDIVAWLNADDFYLPGAFAQVIKAYQKYPNASFYFGDGYRVNEQGKKISNFFPVKPISFNRDLFILGLNYILQPAAFINKKYLGNDHYLNMSLQYGMDSDLWIRLSGVATPQFISTPLAASREYKTTKTATGSFERIEELRAIAKTYSDLPITPGVLCYFLDTLRRFCLSETNVFSDNYIKAIDSFWAATTELLNDLGGRKDGFPKEK